MNHTFRIFKRGYTLVELMVAISILALLFAAGVTSYSKASGRSRDAKRKSDIEQLRSALEMYRADNSSYPSTGTVWQDITIALDTALVSSYMPSLPIDPQSGISYMYQSPIDVGTTTYCLTAFMEVTNESGTCTGYSVPPDGTTSYGVKNP